MTLGSSGPEAFVELFTAAEAASLTGLTVKAVNNTIDRKTVGARTERRDGQIARLLDMNALVLLSLVKRLRRSTTLEFRRWLFAEIGASPDRRIVSLGTLKVDIGEPRRELRERIRELRRAKRIVVSDPEIMGGTPVLRRTRIPVHLIADLLRGGSSLQQLKESYPQLTEEMVRLAPVYASSYPLRGRPRKSFQVQTLTTLPVVPANAGTHGRRGYRPSPV